MMGIYLRMLAPPELGYQNRRLCMVGFQSIG